MASLLAVQEARRGKPAMAPSKELINGIGSRGQSHVPSTFCASLSVTWGKKYPEPSMGPGLA